MKKLAYSILFVLPFVLLACSNDEYVYPSVRLEFITAESGDDGRLQTFVTDKGERLQVIDDRSDSKLMANSFTRAISNYEVMTTANGVQQIRIYAISSTISPDPVLASAFPTGIKSHPADVLSIWMGKDYLNITLTIKAQSAKHLFHFIEQSVGIDEETGRPTVSLLLYHDNNSDVEAYSKRVYLSVPLQKYATDLVNGTIINFSIHTLDGSVKTHTFDYYPSIN